MNPGMSKKMGRPPLDPALARAERIGIRLTESERSELESLAEEAGMSLSEYLRAHLFSESVKITELKR